MGKQSVFTGYRVEGSGENLRVIFSRHSSFCGLRPDGRNVAYHMIVMADDMLGENGKQRAQLSEAIYTDADKSMFEEVRDKLSKQRQEPLALA